MKRALALFLSFVMCVSMFPAGAFAEEEPMFPDFSVAEEPEITEEIPELLTVPEAEEEISAPTDEETPEVPEIEILSEVIAEEITEPVIEDTTLSIIAPKHELTVGETMQLSLSEDIIGSEVVWSSSDEAVLTVDGTGLVTALNEGEATVYVECDEEVLSVEMKVVAEAFLMAATSNDIVDTGTCGDNLTWALTNDGVMEISGTGVMTDYYYPAATPWFSTSSSIKTLKINSGVTTIGDMAFYGCINLTDVIMSDSVTTIAAYAFGLCRSLRDITLGNGMSSISVSAFDFCTSLTAINVSEQNKNYSSEDGVLFNKDKSTVICYPGGKAGEYFIPDSVTSIGDYAFLNCTGLTSVKIPDSVTIIGNSAFSTCNSLTDITMGNGVSSISASAFDFCTSLIEINISEQNENYSSEDGVLFNKDRTALILYPRGKAGEYSIPDSVNWIEDSAFGTCSSLTSVIIPDSVTYIGYSAFYCCSSLRSVIFPEKVTWIGDNAFSSCTNLTDVTIPEKVTGIGSNAFSNCTSLTDVMIPESVTYIGNSAFYYCSGLTDVYYAGSALQWSYISKNTGNDALLNAQIHFGKEKATGKCGDNLTWTFYEDGTLEISGTGAMTDYWSSSDVPWNLLRSVIKTVKINYGVTSICDDAFFYCSNLADITIPKSVTSIGMGAFEACENLTNIMIPDSVTAIGDYAFSHCSKLTSIEIPDSVSLIGDSTFYDCVNLTAINVSEQNSNYSSEDGILFDKSKSTLILYPTGKTEPTTYTIPLGVTTISPSAFGSCTALTVITLPDSVTVISDSAFSGCASLTAINVSEQNSNYSSEDGVLFNKNKTTLLLHPKAKAGAYTIPDSVTVIGDSAFSGCRSLTSLTIPDSVITIGHGAFVMCSALTIVTIGNSVTTIGGFAFQNCVNLTDITMGSSVTTISEYAFSLCGKLKNVTLPDSVTTIGDNVFWGCTSLTDITIPEGVTAINTGTFCDCNGLISITIPDSITNIGDWAFSGCTALNDVYFTGTEAQWNNNIAIDTGNDMLVNANKHFEYVSTRIPGDVNGDGYVGTKDFITLMRYCAGERTMHFDPNALDIDGSGAVEALDYITLMQYLAGMNVEIH